MSAALQIYVGDHSAPRVEDEPHNFARVPVSAISDPRLPDSAVRVLAAILAGLWTQATRAYVTREEIGRACGKSPEAVRRALEVLERFGYLERGRDRTKAGAPHYVELLFRVKAPYMQPHRTEGSTPQKCGVNPTPARDCNPTPARGHTTKRIKREKKEKRIESQAPSATRPGRASPPSPGEGELEELVAGCREGGVVGRLSLVALRDLVDQGVDLGRVVCDPAELASWLEGRDRGEAPAGGSVAKRTPGPVGATRSRQIIPCSCEQVKSDCTTGPQRG